jgi:putative ABC transport system substrate-binding protein
MSKEKIQVYGVMLTISIFIAFILYSQSYHAISELPIVGITQIVEHPSLDEERVAIIHELEKQGYKDGETIKLVYRNAQGNLATSTQIAQQFVSQKVKVLIAISTPSAQTAYAVCLQQGIPLIFSAVTNPIEAKLISQHKPPRPEFVAGVSDAIAISYHLQLMRDCLPKARKLGVLYNSGEINSTLMVAELQKQAKSFGFEVFAQSVAQSSFVSTATQGFVGKVDVVYIPNDNLVISSIQSILPICFEHHIPIFSGDSGSVKAGALATCGYNRSDLGHKTGRLAGRVLKGEAVNTLPIETDHPIKAFFNANTAKMIGFTIPLKFRASNVSTSKTSHDSQFLPLKQSHSSP